MMQNFLYILVIDEGGVFSSLCREFEGAEYLINEFIRYITNKIGSDQRGVALDVDKTEEALDPLNSYAEDNEGNS